MSSTAELYLKVREREGRLYEDGIVQNLPDVPRDHPLSREWLARASSCQRLIGYIQRLQRPVCVLEVGCGNGWVSHRLSALDDLQVWGLDLRSRELEQAARLFNGDNIAFLTADIFQAPFPRGAFDVVIVASAIQYFPDLPRLVRSLQELVGPQGELHILDSPLYAEDELPAARERTRAYYAGVGFPEMADHYFHHTAAELRPFSPHWLYRPESVQARLRRALARPDSPFPWLCIGPSAGSLVV